MKLAIYDPLPMGNEYCTKMFLAPIRRFAADNNIPCTECTSLEKVRDSHVVLLTDHLSEVNIGILKNNGNRIVGINVTDSSYISGAIRYAKTLPLVDLIFMVSGVPNVNNGNEIVVDKEFNVSLREVPFLDDDNWKVFDYMRKSGRLKSLPYIPWTPIPEVVRQPWSQRSQKTLLRGGGHARRFILALFLMAKDKLDPNSGFVLFQYFDDSMNLQFRYCDECRARYIANGRHVKYTPFADAADCNGPHREGNGWNFADLGQWNNRCPKSFFWMAEKFHERYGGVQMGIVEKVLAARWLDPREHQAMLGRILFTSDLKWVHSIYKPQRFWEAASAGCISVLPGRTIFQDYFPDTKPLQHYLVYDESMTHLDLAFSLDESTYDQMSKETRHLYDTWIAPGVYPMNRNLLDLIFSDMRAL